MHMISCPDPQVLKSRTCKFLLGTCWIVGLFFGYFAAAGAGNSFSLMMRGDVSTVSIPGLLITFLPFLLTVAAVFLPHPGFLAPVILWKAFSFGFCACGLTLVFHGTSWLVRLLLMFSEVATVPLLMWLWLRKCDHTDLPCIRELVCCGGAVALIGVLDYCMVSPFAAMLL